MGAVEPIGFERPVLPHGTMFGCDPRIESYVYYHRKGGYNPEHFPYPKSTEGMTMQQRNGR